jgi:hypothetical protein
MRKLLLITACAACGNATSAPRVMPASAWRAPLQCTRLAALHDVGAVSDLVAVSDTSVAALYADDRRLVVYDARLRTIRSLQFDKDGPRGVLRPVSAAIADSMIFVADDARSLIRRFDPLGNGRGTIRLPFIPRRLRLSGSTLLVTPLIAGGSPAQLLFRVDGTKVRALPAPIARYDDINVNTLANLTSIAAFPDRVVVLHELVVPFGYVMGTTTTTGFVRRFGVPVPAAERRSLGKLPSSPVSEQNANELAVIAFAAAPDMATSSVYYVTRTGNGRDRKYRKLLVHMDSALNVKRVFPIDVHPHHLAYLAGRGSVIAVDARDQWSECRLPSQP